MTLLRWYLETASRDDSLMKNDIWNTNSYCQIDIIFFWFLLRYYSLLIFLMGFIIPLTLGALSSATISFVYKASSFRMDETHAMMWGCGQTVVHASFGITRILATLWGSSIVAIESECSDGTQFIWKHVSLENKAWYSLIGSLKCSTKIHRHRKKIFLIESIIF